MTKRLSANEPAFPGLRKQVGENTYEVISNGGLTKREYFSAMAMQGILSNLGIELNNLKEQELFEVNELAIISTACADALLAELAKDAS